MELKKPVNCWTWPSPESRNKWCDFRREEGWRHNPRNQGQDVQRRLLEGLWTSQTPTRFLKESNPELFGETSMCTMSHHVQELSYTSMHQGRDICEGHRDIAGFPFAWNIFPWVRGLVKWGYIWGYMQQWRTSIPMIRQRPPLQGAAHSTVLGYFYLERSRETCSSSKECQG